MWWSLGAVLAGAVTGSFLTTVIERLPQGESFVKGRSRCVRCRAELTARELVPVVSFLWSRGRCRHCEAPIPQWHLWVELATTAIFLVVGVQVIQGRVIAEAVLLLLALCLLLALTVIDLQHMLLPDLLVFLLALAGLLHSVAWSEPGLVSSLLAGILGLVVLGVLAVVPWPASRHPTPDTQHPRSPATPLRQGFGGSPAHLRQGYGGQARLPEAVGGPSMGLGDAKLAGAMGVTLGLQGLLAALFVAFVVGGLVAVLLVLSKRATLKSRVPFGPFLAGATGLVLLVPQLPEAFFHFLGF